MWLDLDGRKRKKAKMSLITYETPNQKRSKSCDFAQNGSDLLNKEFADLLKQKANNSKDAPSFISKAKVVKSKTAEQQN